MMGSEGQFSFESNANILKGRVSKYALRGVVIAFFAIIAATLLVGYQIEGVYSLEAMIKAQKTNIAIWILDFTPFIFAFWGQYVSTIMSYQASALIADQTHELRRYNDELQHKARHESLHDSVTKLPNRFLFSDRLSTHLHGAAQSHAEFSLLTLSICNYKDMRESIGNNNTDKILKRFVSRLSGVLEDNATIARINEDEFAIIFKPSKTHKDAATLANKLHHVLSGSFLIDEMNIRLIIAIGISTFPHDGVDPDTIWQRSAIAMNASIKNHTTYTVYDPKLDTENPNQVLLMGELQNSIESNNLLLYFQPKIDFRIDKVVAAEALVRWEHPTKGLIMPEDFIPLAERTGLIHELSQWVLKAAIKQCAEWRKSGLDLGISINLSPVDILDINLPDYIGSLSDAYEVPPELIELEIIESSVINDIDTSLKVLTRLSDMKFRISIDDFGTGYSSLSYLSMLPVDAVKIDKSLVLDMVDSENQSIIVKATIDMAHNLGLEAVAEGVGDAAIEEKIKALDCDYGQGFYYSKPISNTEFIKWLKERESN